MNQFDNCAAANQSWFKRFNCIICAALLPALLASCDSKPVDWHMINVNPKQQGDAHLLVDNGVNVLIDTGEFEVAEARLVPYLHQQQVDSIDHLFISHPHTDHYGGLSALIHAGIKVTNIYYNLPPLGVEDWNYKRSEFLAVIESAETKGSKVHSVAADDVIDLPNSKIEVLYAHKERQVEGKHASVNDYSIILAWQAAGFKTLFTGDLDSPLGMVLSRDSKYTADLLKVPHHGVAPTAPEAFFDRVQPTAAMIPAPRVLWSHARGSQLKEWVQDNLVYYCHNGRNGNVVLSFSKKTVTSQSDRSTDSCPNGPWQIKPAA